MVPPLVALSLRAAVKRPSTILIGLGAVTVLGLFVVLAFAGPSPDAPGTVSPTATQTAPRADATTPSLPESPNRPMAAAGEVIIDENVQLPEQLAQIVEIWRTDWTKRTIDSLDELLIGIPIFDPRDAIKPIDDPKFESVAEADDWLVDREPGLLLELNGEARFYPLSILTRHEIVNDVVGDLPVAITYCPLCNTGIAFDRRVEGQTLRFGVSGLLRNSDLVMWDGLSDSLWQQITGEAIVGGFAGTRLRALPVQLVRWADFKSAFTNGQVLSQDTGLGRNYGLNPYEYYTSRNRPYRFFQGEIDDRFPALSRVVGVSINDTDAKAYPFSLIAQERTVNDVVGGVPIVVFWGAEDTADALDSPVIVEGQAVGTGVAYERVVDGRELTFEAVDDTTYVDRETGTTWNILGKALEGRLAGKQLTPVLHRNDFWFAWAAFFPDAPVYGVEGDG
jgi:hypothetical protein